MYNILESGEIKDTVQSKDYQMKVWAVKDTDGFTYTVFGCPEYIKQVGRAAYLFVDGTFQTVPRLEGAFQLLTIMFEKFGKVKYITRFC